MSKQKSPRILVIEDEADIAALVAYQLAHAGFQVRTASTGGEAPIVAAQPRSIGARR
jgi:DNA-binding response OmpR family regulator